MLDPGSIVDILVGHGVQFVVIGGIAAQVHNLPVPATVDIDVTPDRTTQNLEQLAQAFEELEAGLLTADAGGTWFPRHPIQNWASYDTLHLMTKHGPLDIVFAPDGAEHGYAALSPEAELRRIGRSEVLVIAVEQWVYLKEASGREKDIEHLNQFRGRS